MIFIIDQEVLSCTIVTYSKAGTGLIKLFLNLCLFIMNDGLCTINQTTKGICTEDSYSLKAIIYANPLELKNLFLHNIRYDQYVKLMNNLMLQYIWINYK